MMIRCLSCGSEGEGYVCAHCGAILPPREEDYYAIFGLPRRFLIDEGLLKARYFELSRLLHPDAHTSDPPELQEAALRWSALVNNAYLTLRDRVRRFRYLLGLETGLDGEGAGRLSPKRFELMERLQDSLALQDGEERRARLRELEEVILKEQEEADEAVDRLAARWDALQGEGAEAFIQEIHARLDDLAYAQKMLAMIREPQGAFRFHG